MALRGVEGKTKPKTFVKLVLGHVGVFLRLNMTTQFGRVMLVILGISINPSNRGSSVLPPKPDKT